MTVIFIQGLMNKIQITLTCLQIRGDVAWLGSHNYRLQIMNFSLKFKISEEAKYFPPALVADEDRPITTSTLRNGGIVISVGGLVSRPDFMGLGLVSKVSVSLETTLSRQDLKEEKNEKRGIKKHSVGGRFPYPQWKNDVFRVEKYLTRKILGLGLGLGLGF